MPGLLQSAQQPQQQAPQMPQQAQQMPQQQDHKVTLERINKVVMAAQTIMYNPKTSKMFMKELQSSGGTAEERAGNAAAGVIAILMQQANGKMDPHTVIPAGVIIVADLMDFIGQTEGQEFGEAENNEAIKIFVEKIIQATGGGQEQMPQEQQVAMEQMPQAPMQGAM